MAKPPMARIELVVQNQSFDFVERALRGFAEAPAFLAYLLDKGTLSHHVMVGYVTAAARLKRQGKIYDPATITRRSDSTAANAYRKWKAESYVHTLQPVRRALGRFLPSPNALTWIRRHALVPPFEGKTVPRKGLVTLPVFTPLLFWDPCDAWTLHIPDKPCDAHTDPCETCTVVPLDETLLKVLGEAFKSAWGHTDLNAVPPDALLFGTPPVGTGPDIGEQTIEPTVGLAHPTPVSNALASVRCRMARDVDTFLVKLSEGADGVYLSREACGDRLQDVLTAVWNAWRAQ